MLLSVLIVFRQLTTRISAETEHPFYSPQGPLPTGEGCDRGRCYERAGEGGRVEDHGEYGGGSSVLGPYKLISG